MKNRNPEHLYAPFAKFTESSKRSHYKWNEVQWLRVSPKRIHAGI